MSNEIGVGISLAVSKGNAKASRSAYASVDMAGECIYHATQIIGDSAEVIDVPAELDTEGYALFKNMDDTNYIELGYDEGGAIYHFHVKLKPGEVALFRLSSLPNLVARANAGDIILEYLIIED